MCNINYDMMKKLDDMIEPYGVKNLYNDNSPNHSAEQIFFNNYQLRYGENLNLDQKKELYDYFTNDYRTFFGREYDRIICTNSFRRLQYKTQVMVNSASDDQRTRLMHSLEVQRIAKKIAIGIKANAELAENIAIAHDIGHAPFGHSGEEAISNFIANKLQKENSGSALYLHAIQSVKVLDKIATHRKLKEYGIDGLGLSDYVLEGVLKHDADVFSESVKSIKQYENVERLLGIVGIEPIDEFYNNHKELTNNVKNEPPILIGSVESQIVAWADKIAYLGHDWEEFLDIGLLEKLMSRINDMVDEMFKIYNKNENTSSDYEVSFINEICGSLAAIQTKYSEDSMNLKETWDTAKEEIKKIIDTVNKVIKTEIKYFTKKEYLALRDYLAMVVSWVKLINDYPKPHALKYDPIYIFYIFLSNIRTHIITKAVSDKMINSTQNILNNIKNDEHVKKELGISHGLERKDYLEYCNINWLAIYNNINNSQKDVKNIKKSIKNSVRTCFLVQFDENYEPCQIMLDENSQFYNFDNTYCCLLNITKCIMDQYIRSTRVKFMGQQADKIVAKLMEYYVEHPDMISYTQRKRYDKEVKLGDDDESNKLYHIADYVGGMTDRMAKKKYDEILSSETVWSKEFQ